MYLIPLWGVIQIVAHTTASSFETREEILKWGSSGLAFLPSQTIVSSRTARRNFLSVILCFATCMAVLCLTQLFTSEGRVLWTFKTGYDDVYATFQNRNNYAQFVELTLPIALWRALREGWGSWWYALSGGVRRVCDRLCFTRRSFNLHRGTDRNAVDRAVEIARSEDLSSFPFDRRHIGFGSCTCRRIHSGCGMAARLAALSGQRSIFWAPGVPCGSFEYGGAPAIDRLRSRDISGGLPAIRNQGFPFLCQPRTQRLGGVCRGWRTPFSIDDFMHSLRRGHSDCAPTPLGNWLIVVMAHACVDYPFPRPAVSGWIFALLAALYMERMSDRALQRTP